MRILFHIVSNFKLSVFILRLHRTVLEALAAEKAAVETNPEEIELDMDEAIDWRVGFSAKVMVRFDDRRCRWGE